MTPLVPLQVPVDPVSTSTSTLLQCSTNPNLFIHIQSRPTPSSSSTTSPSSSSSTSASSACSDLDFLVTDLAALWLQGTLAQKDLRLACPDHLSLQQFVSLVSASIGLGVGLGPNSLHANDEPWHAQVAVTDVMDMTDSQAPCNLSPKYSLDLIDSSNTVQLSVHLDPIPDPDTPTLLRPIMAAYASLTHSLLTARAHRQQPSLAAPPLPTTPLSLSSISSAAASVSTSAAPSSSSASASSSSAPPPKKTTSSSKKATTAQSAATDKHLEKLRREHDKQAKLAAKEAERAAKEAAKEAERVSKEAERAAKLKEKEDAKRERERLAEEKKKKAVQGTARIMDMFVKRVVKPSASDVSSACTGGADAQAAEQQHVEVKYFDTLFVDFVPKRTMTVVPLTHFQRVQDDDAATKSAIDILRSPARHASNLPMLPTHLRQTLVGLPLTDPETANATPLPRFKLLQFAEDLRPAYWGTWRKTSAHVHGRRPFARDASGVLDYEYDSEAEWQDEDEGEGEEIRSEDEADEDESVAGDDVEDDGWLLDDDEFARSAGTSVAAAGGKRVVRSLEPIVLGPFWGGQAKGVDGFAMVWLGENAAPLDPFAGLDLSVAPSKTNNAHSGSSAALGGGSGATPASASRKSNASLFPEEHILTFIRAVHGNPQGVQKIVEELKARPEFASTPKTQLEAKLKAFTVKEKRLTGKLTFYVKDDILRYHRLSPTTLQVEPADPENENENDSDQASPSSAKLPATGTPSTALPRLPFKPLLLAAAVKRTADNATMVDDATAAAQATQGMGSPAKRAKVAGNGLPPLPVAKVRDENENGGLPGVAKEDDEEELGSDDSDDEEEDDEEWESDTDNDGQDDDLIQVWSESDEDAGDDGTEQLAFPSPTPLSTAFRRRPSTALPPPPAHHTLPPPPPAKNDDAMDVDDPDPLLDLSVYDLSTLSGSTTVSPATAPLILRQLLLNKDPLAHQSVALAALGTWAASTRLPDSASQLSSSDMLVASPDFWALLPRCLASRDLRANSLRMMQPACAQDPSARDEAVQRVVSEMGSYVWQAVEAAVSEKDVLGINYGLAVIGDMAGVPVDVGEDGERVVEQVWAKVRQVVEWAAMSPICAPGCQEDLVTHGRRCALAAMYQYLSTLVDFENEALVTQVMERGGAKQAYRLRVQALNELEWVKMEESFAKTVDECVSMLSP